MGDTKQGDQGDTGSTSGKPNKFDKQNQHAEERKAGEGERQGEPAVEPTEKVTEITETPKEETK